MSFALRAARESGETQGVSTWNAQLDSGHRRRRLHRLQLRPAAHCGDETTSGGQSRQAHLRRQSATTWIRFAAQSTAYFRAGRHLRSRAGAQALAAPRAAGDRALRRREPCRPLDPRARGFHPTPTSNGTFEPAGRGARLLGGLAETRTRRVPLPARVDRRGVRLARRPTIRRFTETTPYAPNSPYSASKAAVRPPGARLPSHLRLADADHQLLEQLRPVPVSGKADSAA